MRTKRPNAKSVLERLARAAGMLPGRQRLTFLLGALEGHRSGDCVDMGHRADLIHTLRLVIEAMKSTDPKNPIAKRGK